MNKVFVIIKREYLTRVKKKSFIIMTILIPLLMGALMLFPILISQLKSGRTDIMVIDKSGFFENKINNSDNLYFSYNQMDFEEAKQIFQNTHDGILNIPEIDIQRPSAIRYYSDKQVGLGTISHIRRELEREIERLRLEKEGLDDDFIEKLRVKIDLETVLLTDRGEKAGSTEIAAAMSYVMGFILYMMLISYGTLIARSVSEEKKNRIVELVISSVKPFQLMLGKIIGVAAVALTQIIIWIILGSLIFMLISLAFMPELMGMQSSTPMMGEMNNPPDEAMIMKISEGFEALNMTLIISMFVLFFLFGYLLYSALFAAIGAISDEASENQSITLPVLIPIILSLLIMVHVLDQPNSPLAMWSSLIPFFAPIVMVSRLPFSVPAWQIIVSIVLLMLTFWGTVWMSGKIYRTGILLYGKKITLKEIWKWVINK
jgi:ABC-2 type transport system permease protein